VRLDSLKISRGISSLLLNFLKTPQLLLLEDAVVILALYVAKELVDEDVVLLVVVGVSTPITKIRLHLRRLHCRLNRLINLRRLKRLISNQLRLVLASRKMAPLEEDR
jgi:hypothetical protein